MNKSILGVMLTIALSIDTTAIASTTVPPEVDLADIKGSMWEHYQSLPNLSNAYYSSKPMKRDDGIEVGELKGTTMQQLAKEIANGKHTNYDSLLIAHKGKLVFESYFQRGRANLPHLQASATKSYTSLAVGRAIQLGYLSMKDLHKPVLQFLKEIDTKNLPSGIEKITLHHTLSMRSGLRITTGKEQEILENPDAVKGQQLAKAYFMLSEPVTKESQSYRYQASDPNITMLVLDTAVPEGVMSFIQTELLAPLKLRNTPWEKLSNGLPNGGAGSSMTSREMIKWGLLLEQKGKWQGKQLIPQKYLKQATSRIAKPHDEDYDFSSFRYGYYFWGTQLTVGEKNYDLKLAWGGGGQYVIVVEALDLVIAITSFTRMQDDKTFDMLEKRILPIFANPQKIASKKESLKKVSESKASKKSLNSKEEQI